MGSSSQRRRSSATLPGVSLLPLVLAGCFWISEAERDARWDLDGDGVERPEDCDDGDPDRAAEATYYADADGDGFGDQLQSTTSCGRPQGFVDNGDDCDDTSAQVAPGAVEQCNDIDDDCDGLVDEEAAEVAYYPDVDEDGAGDANAEPVYDCRRPAGYVSRADDCDDRDPEIGPLADEVCNGYDDDCDELVDLDDPDLPDSEATWYRDEDGDGFGIDTDTLVTCDPPEGWSAVGGDCRDDDDEVNPAADERCNDVDDDCDDETDEDAIDAIRYFVDDDGDGFGDLSQPVDACSQPPGTAGNGSDCDDDNPLGYPGAPEVCDNGLNDDCTEDMEVDEKDCVVLDTSDTSDTSDTATPSGTTSGSPSTADTGDSSGGGS